MKKREIFVSYPSRKKSDEIILKDSRGKVFFPARNGIQPQEPYSVFEGETILEKENFGIVRLVRELSPEEQLLIVPKKPSIFFKDKLKRAGYSFAHVPGIVDWYLIWKSGEEEGCEMFELPAIEGYRYQKVPRFFEVEEIRPGVYRLFPQNVSEEEASHKGLCTFVYGEDGHKYSEEIEKFWRKHSSYPFPIFRMVRLPRTGHLVDDLLKGEQVSKLYVHSAQERFKELGYHVQLFKVGQSYKVRGVMFVWKGNVDTLEDKTLISSYKILGECITMARKKTDIVEIFPSTEGKYMVTFGSSGGEDIEGKLTWIGGNFKRVEYVAIVPVEK